MPSNDTKIQQLLAREVQPWVEKLPWNDTHPVRFDESEGYDGLDHWSASAQRLPLFVHGVAQRHIHGWRGPIGFLVVYPLKDGEDAWVEHDDSLIATIYAP